MIVKVQLSLYPPDGSGTFIYNEDRSVTLDTLTTPELRQRMGTRVKAFFHAALQDGQIKLEGEAPWQKW